MAQLMFQPDSDQAVASALGRSAWIAALRGIVAVLFGFTALFWPGITLPTLVLLFGVYAFADGFLSLIAAFRMTGRHDPWIALLLEGIVGISVGVITLRTPGLAAVAVVYVVGTWAIVTGVLEMVAAIELRKSIAGEWALGFSGLFSVILGWLLIAQPQAGILTLVWILGFYAVFFGSLMIFVGFRMSRLLHKAGSAVLSER